MVDKSFGERQECCFLPSVSKFDALVPLHTIKNSKHYILKISSLDGVNYTEIARSNCDHDGAGLAVYGDKALTTAGPHAKDKQKCWKRTETYDFEANEWTDEADYTFAE